MNKPLRIAVAGLGTVGGGVASVLLTRGKELEERAGRTLELVGVSARDKSKSRAANVSKIAWENDARALVKSDADVIVELIGGEEGVAYDLVKAALTAKKHVVTANKALLAYHGAELAALAEENNVALKFEAAAAGGIPIVKALRESLIAYGIDSVRGILNGTCNYILTQMEATGQSFGDVLRDAQKLGYAESDPTLDVGGGDTAHKLAVLSALAFGVTPNLKSMKIEGIEHITPDDIRFAREFGYRIKLLGLAHKRADHIDQRVQPAMVRLATSLAAVEGPFNAVVANAGEAGPFFFEGRGAGEAPTAGAVIADLVDIARGSFGAPFGRPAKSLARNDTLPGPRSCAFYLRFEVLDVPGVLAEIAGTLAESEVSIESMIQRGRAPGEPVAIVMITHECVETSVASALKAIAASAKVVAKPCMIPMESR
jgi:homoserine dehydrogenase